jgi:hypothetical protein
MPPNNYWGYMIEPNLVKLKNNIYSKGCVLESSNTYRIKSNYEKS